MAAKDSNGNELKDGDSVQDIKDLKLKSSPMQVLHLEFLEKA